MSNEDEKWKNTLMWIASVAVSVLCCSAIFVVFASYLVDIKNDIHENNARLALIEKRQDAIFAEFDFIHKHVAGTPAMPVAATDGQMTSSDTAPMPPVPVTPPPAVEPPPAPISVLPAPTPVQTPPAPDAVMSPNSAPVVTPPTITVPTMPTTPDKK